MQELKDIAAVFERNWPRCSQTCVLGGEQYFITNLCIKPDSTATPAYLYAVKLAEKEGTHQNALAVMKTKIGLHLIAFDNKQEQSHSPNLLLYRHSSYIMERGY